MSAPQQEQEPDKRRIVGRDWVALLLAVGIATAINLITFAVLWDALFNEQPGLSDNAVTVLTTAFSGAIGVLGSYIGIKAGQQMNGNGSPPKKEEER